MLEVRECGLPEDKPLPVGRVTTPCRAHVAHGSF